MKLFNAVAIVTGSATGSGAACALQLARKGCRVVVNYTKSEQEARETVEACRTAGVEALLVQGDVANDADCRRMAQAALDKWGRIDVLINNAGITKFVAATDLEGLTTADWQHLYAVNVIGAYQMIRACVPAMQKQGEGAIVNISSISGVLGIVRTYATRVGEGPFPTEMLDEEEDMANLIRQRGNEYGSVTKRPRRCGWFDAVATRYAAELNGFDSIALTKLDVLDALEEIKVCVGYEVDGKRIDTFPAVSHDLRMIKPVYETLAGWQSDTVGVTEFAELPEKAKDYVRFLSDQVGVEIGLISTGPERDQTIILRDSVMESWFSDSAAVATAES